jgi:prepilin-type N-terminal cleavage/methylation domain-containing protein
MKKAKKQSGFSLLELLVAVTILVIVAGAVMAGMISTTRSQSSVMNRTQLHASVRNATELMEQEIGQAGKLGASPGLQFSTAVAAIGSTSPTITTTSGTATTGLYVGEQLVVDPSTTNEETVTISAIPSSTSITATFANTHPANTPVLVLGGFASGIIPPDTSSKYVFSGTGTANTTLTTGTTGQSSSGSTLKLYGDINSVSLRLHRYHDGYNRLRRNAFARQFGYQSRGLERKCDALLYLSNQRYRCDNQWRPSNGDLRN